MPIHERDPWRRQYFAGVACPEAVQIPTDDADAYRWYPRYRWLFNKLNVAESQGLACAPHGVEPPHFPVFSKPIFNLDGMAVGSRMLHDRADYLRHNQPGHLWMTYLEGEHISSDLAVVDGQVRWARHALGVPGPRGTFDYWTIESQGRPGLEDSLTQWIRTWLGDYTGMLNLETIGGFIIDAHLRFTDQWPDLYGAGWLDAMVGLYARRVWDYADRERVTGYSVALFGPHGRRYRHPESRIADEILASTGVTSLQITFHDDRADLGLAMPPGGFRLAVINAWDLRAGMGARRRLAEFFGVGELPHQDDFSSEGVQT
jgi:hypothetical protein